MEKSLKENTNMNQKQNLFNSLQNSGVIETLKSQMRTNLLQQLQKPSKTIAQKIENDKLIENQKASLNLRIICSLFADFLKTNDMKYSLSVFMPESGFSGKTLARTELLQVLNLDAPRDMLTSLIEQIIDRIISKTKFKETKDNGEQTDEGNEGLSLEYKLKQIDEQYTNQNLNSKANNLLLEERFIKYKRDYEAKMKEQYAADIQRFKETEVSNIRLEESSKSRAKMMETRNELDRQYSDKLQSLKSREQEFNQLIKNRERQIEQQAFELRQNTLKNLESSKLREEDLRRREELNEKKLRMEKDQLEAKEKIMNDKLHEVSELKAKELQKINEEVEKFKREFMARLENERSEILSTKKIIDEKEYKQSLFEAQKSTVMNENEKLKFDNDKLRVELQNVLKKNTELSAELNPLKEQYKLTSDSAQRENFLLAARTTENQRLSSELEMVSKNFNEYKTLCEERKYQNENTIQTLRIENEKLKENVNQVQSKYELIISKIENTHKSAIDQERKIFEDALKQKEDALKMVTINYKTEKSFGEKLYLENNRKLVTFNMKNDLRNSIDSDSSLEDITKIKRKTQLLEKETEDHIQQVDAFIKMPQNSVLPLYDYSKSIGGSLFTNANPIPVNTNLFSKEELNNQINSFDKNQSQSPISNDEDKIKIKDSINDYSRRKLNELEEAKNRNVNKGFQNRNELNSQMELKNIKNIPESKSPIQMDIGKSLKTDAPVIPRKESSKEQKIPQVKASYPQEVEFIEEISESIHGEEDNINI